MPFMQQPRPSMKQIQFVFDLQHQLHMSDFQLMEHCRSHYETSLMQMTRSQVSALIDELFSWKELPANLQRAAGQQDLPGLEAG